MRGNEFLDKMDLVDPAYVEAADVVPKRKKVWTGWRAAVAACICLVVLAGTAAAVTIRESGVRAVDIFNGWVGSSGQLTSGYSLNAEVRKFSISELSKNMEEVSGEIVHQFETGSSDSDVPGVWIKRCSSAEEARKFVGLEAVKRLDRNMGEHQITSLLVRGDADGKIQDVSIYTICLADDVVLNMQTKIFTEYTDNAAGKTGFLALEDVEITEAVYTAAGGKECQIMSYFSPKSNRRWINGYLVDDGILYSLYANCTDSDTTQAEALLHQWADMF